MPHRAKPPIILSVKRYLPYLYSLLGGLTAAFSMPPAGLWPCLLIGVSVVFYQWFHAARYRAAFFHGYLFGIGYFTTGLWWIGNALLIEGNEFWWVWPISVIGLPALLSFFTGLSLAIAKIFFHQARLSTWIGFAALLTLSEMVRGTIMTGFPWNLYGYAWSRVPEMLQSASLFGSYTLTFLTLLLAAAPAFLWLARLDRVRRTAGAALAIVLTLSLYGYGAWRLSHETTYNDNVVVRVVQANIEQSMKWDASLIVPHFEKHLDLSAKAPIEQDLFILWPETAIPPMLLDNEIARDKIEALLTSQSTGNAYLLTGALVHKADETGERYYNALLAFDKRAEVRAAYAKTRLVPFGEFIPFQQWIPLRPVVQFQGFERGDGPNSYQIDNMPAFSPLVCYEIIFPGRVVDKDDRPALLAAVTNDGWYGDSAGPHQHFFQVTVRAIEEGLPAIRSANTGISGIIDPYGRIVAQSDLFAETAIDAMLPAALPPPPFARTGNGIWLLALLTIVSLSAVRAKYIA